VARKKTPAITPPAIPPISIDLVEPEEKDCPVPIAELEHDLVTVTISDDVDVLDVLDEAETGMKKLPV